MWPILSPLATSNVLYLSISWLPIILNLACKFYSADVISSMRYPDTSYKCYCTLRKVYVINKLSQIRPKDTETAFLFFRKVLDHRIITKIGKSRTSKKKQPVLSGPNQRLYSDLITVLLKEKIHHCTS